MAYMTAGEKVRMNSARAAELVGKRIDPAALRVAADHWGCKGGWSLALRLAARRLESADSR